jgi:hypothetical protein
MKKIKIIPGEHKCLKKILGFQPQVTPDFKKVKRFKLAL